MLRLLRRALFETLGSGLLTFSSLAVNIGFAYGQSSECRYWWKGKKRLKKVHIARSSVTVRL